MFCRKCGAKIPQDSQFCPYCGDRVELYDRAAGYSAQPAGEETPLEQEYREDIFSRQGLFSITGRRTRTSFFFMNILVFFWLSGSSDYMLLAEEYENIPGSIFGFALLLVSFCIAFTNIVKRAHDAGYTAKVGVVMIILGWIPMFNIIAGLMNIYLTFASPQFGTNAYGRNPRELPVKRSLEKRLLILAVIVLSIAVLSDTPAKSIQAIHGLDLPDFAL